MARADGDYVDGAMFDVFADFRSRHAADADATFFARVQPQPPVAVVFCSFCTHRMIRVYASTGSRRLSFSATTRKRQPAAMHEVRMREISATMITRR